MERLSGQFAQRSADLFHVLKARGITECRKACLCLVEDGESLIDPASPPENLCQHRPSIGDALGDL